MSFFRWDAAKHRLFANPMNNLSLRQTVAIACFVFAFGILAEDRIPWTTSGFQGTPDPPLPFSTEQVYPLAKFNNPVSIVYSPDWNRYFVLQMNGKLFSFSADIQESPSLVVDLKKAIPGVQRGYGIAFDPNFRSNRYVYLCFIRQNKDPEGTAVARFRMPSKPMPELEIDSKLEIIHWLSGGHNGGCLKFGPDGYLYISTGDAAAPSPPDRLQTGQDVSDLLAGILRIDVRQSSRSKRYRIPADNPFVGLANTREEIWAYGMRNPWRMSFDSETGELWTGDVGWELWEMIYRVERGGNYGWSVVEGRQPVNQKAPRGPTPILLPTAEHPHSEARSITGGFVYRGNRIPQLYGQYIYGDYVSGKMWALPASAKPLDPPTAIANTNIQIIAFGESATKDLLILDYVNGSIHRLIEPPHLDTPRQFPQRLSESGLFADIKQHQLAPGVDSYTINAEPWEDSTDAQRFIAIPNNQELGKYPRNRFQQGEIKDAWSYPEGSILGKTISLQGPGQSDAPSRRVETQILHRWQQRWMVYSYVWDEDQSDAHLAPAQGLDISVQQPDPTRTGSTNSSSYHIPSRTECILCHTTQAGSVLGFNEGQLNSKQRRSSQLTKFAAMNYFERRPRGTAKTFVDPYDEEQDIHSRARSYLHVNCAHCHRFGGGGTAIFDVRYELDDEASKLFASLPIQGTFGIAGAQIISPKDPFSSLLYYRMAKLGQGRMPHFGARKVDTQGLAMLSEWIQSLPENLSLNPDGATEIKALRKTQHMALENYRRTNKANSPTATSNLNTLLNTPSGAAILADSIRPPRPRLSKEHRKQAVASGTNHDDARIRDLFTPFISEDQRLPRLGLNTSPESILSLSGNVQSGRKIFRDNQSLRCLECHLLGDKGNEVGPSLKGIGGRNTKEEILQSLLEPSEKIAPEFAAKMIETSEGDIYSGFVVEESPTNIRFRALNEGTIDLPKDSILSIETQSLSLMPQFLLQDLTPQQAADLLAFLTSLR